MSYRAAKARFYYLGNLISRYAHRWSETQDRGGEPSQRMYGWVDEYNDLRESQPEAFADYCAERGFCPTHTAYDCLA